MIADVRRIASPLAGCKTDRSRGPASVLAASELAQGGSVPMDRTLEQLDFDSKELPLNEGAAQRSILECGRGHGCKNNL